MKRFPFFPTVVVLVIILYLSLTEQPIDPDRIHLFKGADKVVHGCMYLALVWTGCFDCYRLTKQKMRIKWLLVTLVAMTFGGVMELLQGAITVERSADVIDFVANCCGAIAGVLLAGSFVPRAYHWLEQRI